ncbi:pyridoxal phosphate-dependent aminotransferase [Komagataeibacter rhaeticus]|uniref:Aminotransferase n=1 Tax=Komagataeibacter rhaeticus TaxID=215221 RepID=A0A181C9G9_9PROT|nr:pyridoxal phosphate-dependent aminotransferase [Komagataeibacter rhaeticus]ATU73189.1 pyridoxal phosphate-dependent aminotransferase [Komagataeibacter xylinus]QIP35065.1 pyridoxal phosphate-dependent aminotransferase [Komagataeibacter rhaeticus]QOC47618.1 pyridoxal phosphate-dependent aminotransferase [Komagataeibacter rhaeticus]WPP23033.1 pyridoxal phosphate-dependent aminotransferase [Komagataeibacter rhaeticus]SAY48219.1 Aspartate aminotransferase [Komagataeibacter rhaeticus]
MPGFADRLNGIGISASAAMTDKASELRAEGLRIISLSSGEPDFPTPVHAVDAAIAAARAGDTKYPPQAGKPALKKAIQAKFQRENHLDYALDEILVANGAKQIIYDAMMATINPGDEVVLPTPYWISYADIARLGGASIVQVPCPASNNFRLSATDLNAAITPATKWLVLNFPSNPTGACCPRKDMEEIAAVLLKHPHVWILTDDIYEHLVYDDFQFCTLAEVEPRLKDRVLTVNGVSKAYAMTGWRVGFCGGPRDLIAAMNNMQGQSTSGINTLAQAAALAALEGPQDFLKDRAAEYQARRDLVVSLLNAIPGVQCHTPQGAFYVYPDISACMGKTSAGGRRIENDTDFVMALLEEQQVASVQGAAYGMSPFFRISYATDTATLREGCRRIAEFVTGLK